MTGLSTLIFLRIFIFIEIYYRRYNIDNSRNTDQPHRNYIYSMSGIHKSRPIFYFHQITLYLPEVEEKQARQVK